MICSDKTIRKQMVKGRIVIDPDPYDWQLQPASVDLTLADQWLSPYTDGEPLRQGRYLLGPGECILARTTETITIPDDMVARVEGKSSWGRKFLMVHSTAGFIDPGFHGTITLELVNLSAVSQMVMAGDSVVQISFSWVDHPVERPYGSPGLGSHYQDQHDVTPSVMPWH